MASIQSVARVVLNPRFLLKALGFVVLSVVTIVFALQLTFPYDRVKDKVIDALADKYDVTIGGVSRGILPGRLTFTAVSLRSRPAKSDDPVTVIFIEKLDLSASVLSALRGKLSLDVDAKMGAGTLRGTVAFSSFNTTTADLHVDFEGHDLPGGSLPLRDYLGLPIIGKIDLSIDADLPNEKNKAGRNNYDLSKGDATVEFGCPSGCTFGDGKTKLKPKIKNARNAAFAADGIDFGTVNLDMLLARVELKDGKFDITKFETKSPDGELHVDLGIVLQPDLNDSQVTGCLRFKGSEALLKREPKTYAAIQTTGAPLAPDGLFDIRLDGKLRDVRRLGQVCGAGAPAEHDEAGGSGITKRPNLAVHGDTPSITIEPKPMVTVTPGSAPMPPPPLPPPPASMPVEERHDAGVVGGATGTAGGSGSAAEGSAASGSGTAGSGSAGLPVDPDTHMQ